MRIGIISPSKFPGTTGDTANYLELIKELSQKGLEVFLICPHLPASEGFDRNMKKQGVIIVRVPVVPPRLLEVSTAIQERGRIINIFSLFLTLLTFWFIETFIVFHIFLRRRIKYCLIRHSLLTINLPLILKMIGVVNIVDGQPLYVTTLFRLIGSTPNLYMIPRILSIVERKILSMYSFYWVSTKSQREFLIKLGYPEHRIILSKIGIDINQVPIYDLAGIPPYTFGYFGTLDKNQGVDLLVTSFAKLVDNIEAYLYIIGDGPLKEELISIVKSNGIEKNVILISSVPRETLWKNYFRKFRVSIIPRPPLVVPVIPIKLIESLAAGKPTISSDTLDMDKTEALSMGIVLIPPNDEDSLVSAMYSLLNDEQYLLSLSRKALYAAKQFEINQVVSKLLRIAME